jgi:hypothetical protein
VRVVGKIGPVLWRSWLATVEQFGAKVAGGTKHTIAGWRAAFERLAGAMLGGSSLRALRSWVLGRADA